MTVIFHRSSAAQERIDGSRNVADWLAFQVPDKPRTRAALRAASGASLSGIRHGFWPLQISRRHQGGGLPLLRRESQTLVDFLAWIG